MKIAIGSDKSGYVVKEAVKAYLAEAGIEFDDLGTTDLAEIHPYYRVASGMCVVSNKFKGAYAVACEGVYAAKMARAINNANILCMGGWIVGPEMAIEMVKTFLATEWCQDLEDWRKENMKKFSKEVAAIEDKIYG